MNKQISILAIEYPFERALFAACSVILAVLFFAYFYFVVASVLNIIDRREADANAARMQGSIGSLEQQYFALSQSLSPQEANSLGLIPIQHTEYVYRPGNAASANSSGAQAI